MSKNISHNSSIFPLSPNEVLAKEDEEEWRKNLFTINPLSILLGAIDLEYQRGLLENLAIGGKFQYLFWGIGFWGVGDFSISSLGIGPHIGVFFTGKAPEGLNLSTGFVLAFFSARVKKSLLPEQVLKFSYFLDIIGYSVTREQVLDFHLVPVSGL